MFHSLQCQAQTLHQKQADRSVIILFAFANVLFMMFLFLLKPLSGQQVDLHTLKVLTGIATQGAISKETEKTYYVTTFKLEVSTNGEDWMVYRHGKNHKVGANTRSRCTVFKLDWAIEESLDALM